MSPAVRAVLSNYPHEVAALNWKPLGAAGGFSGAAVWRGELRAGEQGFALKAWPPGTTVARLRDIHRAKAYATLPFVPAVAFTAAGETAVAAAGRVWDVTAWMPGVADFSADPSDARLAAAMSALAALHRAWRPAVPNVAVCPGVTRRREVLDRVLVGRVPFPTDEPTRRTASLLPACAARAAASLRPWADTPLPLQVCLRDIWHDHVLFTGDRVTGVIDYGAVNIDHPAVDLARLLGDFVGTNPGRVRHGVDVYNAAGEPVDAGFVLALADAGLVGSVLHWLDKFAAGVPVGPAAERRFRGLAARLETRAASG